MTRAAIASLALAATLGLGCHPAPPAQIAALSRAPLVAAGHLVAAVEQAGALYLVAPDKVTIERSGSATATVPVPAGQWADAITMPGLDDTGVWVVARTTTGALWRITAIGDLEPIHDLLGLPPQIRSFASGANTVGLALDHDLAILHDRSHLARFAAQTAPGDTVLASRDRVAIRRADQLDVWNLDAQNHASFHVPETIAAGFADPASHGTLVVATHGALFVEHAGDLRRLPAPAEIRSLAIAGARVWIATTNGVFLLDGDHFTRAGVVTADSDRLFGLASGDLVLATPATITRLSLERSGDDPRWAAEVAPIFKRVCAKCHNPAGDSGVDLSTAASWRTEHTELVHRVLDTGTMPPAGTPLSDDDRKTLAAWLR